ncbi:MAG: hypothetical protein JJE13_09020 [Thermoleophilia bacterium]|nr:hypothetical protein [Thermoleophilia bacterium]
MSDRRENQDVDQAKEDGNDEEPLSDTVAEMHTEGKALTNGDSLDALNRISRSETDRSKDRD